MINSVISIPVNKVAAAVNALHTCGINVRKGRIRKDRYYFSFRPEYTSQVIKIMDERSIGYVIVRQGGKNYIARAAIGNIGAIAAIVAVIVAAAVCYGYVFKVDVTGGNETEQALVMQIIEEEGLNKPVEKKKLDVDALRTRLYNDIPSLAFVSVKVKGTRLKVNMVMQHDNPAQPAEYDNIYAAADGVVTRLVVYSGTAMVSEGQRVLKGDLLIAGKRVTGQDDKGQDIYSPCKASGMVEALVWTGGRKQVATSCVTWERTGESVSFRRIKAFGQYIGKDKGCEFSSYEKVVREINSVSLPPFSIEETVYYETKPVVKEISDSDCAVIAAEFDAEIRLSVKEGSIINNTYKNIKRLDNLYIIDIYYEVYTDISSGGE